MIFSPSWGSVYRLLDVHSSVPEVNLSIMFWATNLDLVEGDVTEEIRKAFVIYMGNMGQISSIIFALVTLTFPVSYLWLAKIRQALYIIVMLFYSSPLQHPSNSDSVTANWKQHRLPKSLNTHMPQNLYNPKENHSRSQWPSGLRGRSTAAQLLRSWVRIPPEAWMFVCCGCCVLSGRGLCDELITRPEESYRLWCVVVCDLETSWMRRPWPTEGWCAKETNSDIIY